MNPGKIIKNSSENTDLPAIDWNLCIKLANNKKEIAQEILGLVIKQLPQDLQDIRRAQDKADYAELLRCVHKLHGALCYSGMPRLKQAVASFEQLLKQKVLDQVQLAELSKQVEREVEKVLSSPLPN